MSRGTKIVLFLLFLIILAKLPSSESPKPSAQESGLPSRPASVDQVQESDAAYRTKRVSLHGFEWKNVGGYAIANFIIHDAGDRPVLHSSLRCSFLEPLLKI
jgi:hypothetical protein